MTKGIGGHQSAKMGTDVWLTPPPVIEALGGHESFDLDPCAAIGQPWPTATAHFTIDDNGLAQEWNGRIWLNPPYGQIMGKWLNRLAGHGTGTALIFARTETEMFHRHVWEQCDALLFLEGRLYFHHADGTRAKANGGAPSVLCAYGVDDADILAESGINGKFVPLRLRALTFGFETVGTWAETVSDVMQKCNGPVTLDWLYRALAGSPKTKRNNHWREKIRQTLQRGPFEPLGDGQWKLI